MPTGYTADIKDGISFSTFALNCARAFGATITLRDESGGGEKIPDQFEPSDYHSKALEKAEADLLALGEMTPEACQEQCYGDFAADEAFRLDHLQKNKAQIDSYRSMLEQVKAWTPPSADHVGMKDFMIEQIESSIKFDDSSAYYGVPTERLTGPEWLERKKEKALKDIEYHKTKHAEEVQRTGQRNAWIKALRDSL